MRYYPTNDDAQEVKELNAAPWQLELLKLNPSYLSWGNYEDYMRDKDAGWRSPVELNTFSEKWKLDELNELVNFYFEIYRKHHECPYCEGTCYNAATKEIQEGWYSARKEKWIWVNEHRRYNDLAWSNHITDDEVMELLKNGRLWDLTDYKGSFNEETGKWTAYKDGSIQEIPAPTPGQIPSAQAVNEWNRTGIGHDAINRIICVRQRAKRLGVYGHCGHCDGQGVIYDEPAAHVALQLWFIFPRKGASCGVYIKNIEQNELPEVYEYLREAARRNADRFSKLP